MLSKSLISSKVGCLNRLVTTTLTRRFSSDRFNNEATKAYIDDEYDVIIVGGGLVGGTMACALGKSPYLDGKRILMLEGGSRMSTNILTNMPRTYSNRVCAVSPGNVHFLRSLDIWDHVPRSSPVKKMQVWDSCSDSMIVFEKEHMQEDLCYITENMMLVAAITKILETELKDKVEVQYEKKITACEIPTNYVHSNVSDPHPLASVTLEDGSVLATKLLIGADGARSFVTKRANIPKIDWSYDESAVVATLKLNESTENVVAWQRFLPNGPIALLPLDDQTSSLVWSTTHEHANELIEMDEEEFVSQINTAFWKEHPQDSFVKSAREFQRSIISSPDIMQFPPNIHEVCGQREKFPLGFSHASEYVKPGLAIIGDAAHRIHPLAGQGLNLGFRDVKCLTRVLNKAIYSGEYIGLLSHLLDYETERQRDNLPIALTVDLLKRLFSTDNPAIIGLRSVGLSACNVMNPLKEFFLEEAVK